MISFEADGRPVEAREGETILTALMVVESGTCDGATKCAWSKVAKALREIKGATPDVTPAEIARRAANYRRHFDGAALTATALASHWARCDAEPAPRAAPERRSWLPSGTGGL